MSDYYNNYDKRIADALERIARQNAVQPAIVVGTGPRTVGDPPYTTTSASITIDPVNVTYTRNDDDNLTPTGEPSV